jgi:hypothetical protein
MVVFSNCHISLKKNVLRPYCLYISSNREKRRWCLFLLGALTRFDHPLSSGKFWIFEVKFEIVFASMYCGTVALTKFDSNSFPKNST